MNASKHKLVTPGCPRSSVGNDPSARCCVISQSSDRSIDASNRRHSSGARTFDCGSSASRLAADLLAAVSTGCCCERVPSPTTNATKSQGDQNWNFIARCDTVVDG